MASILEDLYRISPILELIARYLIVISSLILLWILISLPASIAYAALKNGLLRAGEFFTILANKLLEKSKLVWIAGLELRHRAIDSLTIRYVYDKSEHRLIKILSGLADIAKTAGTSAVNAGRSLEEIMVPLNRELQNVSNTTHSPSVLATMPEMEELQNSSLMRRSSFLMLVFILPLVVALVFVNTALLTKFFESFFEEYISYQLGIKWATMLGLFFSTIEISCGVIMYYISKNNSQNNSLTGPALKALILLIILGFASIEGFLYLMLSADIARQASASGLNLPAQFESFRHWWLAPFGFGVVVCLALTGHLLIDGFNKFVEAGRMKELRLALEEFKRGLTRMDSIWDDLRTRINTAKMAILAFRSDLAGQDNTTTTASVIASVKGALAELTATVNSLIALRREPFSHVSKAEATSVFDTHIFLSLIFLVTLVVFCWLQIHYLGTLPDFENVHWSIFLLIGLLESGAILVAGYKAYPANTVLTEGIGTEAIHSPREHLIGLSCLAVVISCVLLNLFLTRNDSTFQWAVMFSLSLASIGVLVVLGRTLTLLMFVLSTVIQQNLTILGAAIWLAAYAIIWCAHITIRLFIYGLYLAAFPFIFIFWKSQLGDPVTHGEIK